MRTRKSNKTKSFKAQTYDFDADFSDDASESRQPFAGRAQKEDGDFDVAGADHEESPDEDPEPDVSPSESSAEEPDVEPTRKKLVNTGHIRKGPVKGQTGSAKYIGIEKDSVPGRAHVPLGYAGIPDRHVRGVNLAQYWYGPKSETRKIALQMLNKWLMLPFLPPREEPKALKQCVWEGDLHTREAEYADAWLEKIKASESELVPQVLRVLSPGEAAPWDPTSGMLPTVTGTYNQQKEWKSSTFDSTVLSDNGVPLHLDEHESKEPTGWMIDTGNLVVDMDWATRREAEAPQWLALAVIPHSDQELYDYEREAFKPDFQKTGAVQIWEFKSIMDEEGRIRTASHASYAQKILCFDTGRARRVKWSPACEHLAVICGDGKVYIVDPKMHEAGFRVKVDRPLTLIALEDGIQATSLVWVTFNRLVIGYADGSVALWSIFPTRILARHAIHHSPVVSIASGYPSKPYSIASTPLGGHLKLFDFRYPSCEATEIMNLSINPQPGLLQWSDHLKGFFTLTPSSATVNTTIGFTNHDFFPIVRRISSLESLVTCIAVGRTHPFLLIGGLDGTLTAMNPHFELFQLHNSRNERADKLKIFRHEHQPPERLPPDSPARARGASRILHGFRPEKNYHVSVNKTKVMRSKGKGSKKKEKDDETFVEDDEEDEDDGKTVIQVREPKRAIVYEPLTRITAVEWNPNEGYGAWAAAALGSGLVKVMDLGLEPR